MKQRREIKIGDKVRFEHWSFYGTKVGRITEQNSYRTEEKQYMVKDAVSPGYHITRRQIISVFIKKQKPPEETFWANAYGDELWIYKSKESANDPIRTSRRTALLELRLVRRHKA